MPHLPIPALWISTLALLWLPGAVLTRMLRLPPHPDWLVRLALQVGLGMSFWPMLLLGTTTFGLHWSAQWAQTFAFIMITAGGIGLVWVPRLIWRRRLIAFRRQLLSLSLWTSIAALTVGTRLLQIRGLALPPWVDSIHHLAIVRLLVEQGHVPATFDPFIPGAPLTYHWGFHALVTWSAWLWGVSDPFDLADLLLQLGQFLNALSVLMLYAGGRVLFASRRAGLFAAVGAGTLFWFPSYFLTWGRYTHLTGTLLLVVVIIQMWSLRRHLRWGEVLAATLLLAGLGLIHVRIAFYGALLLALLGVILLWKRQWRTVSVWLAATAGAVLCTLPWWMRVLQANWAVAMLTPRQETSDYWANVNQVDWSLLWAPRAELLLSLAGGGLSTLWHWQNLTWTPRLLGVCLLVSIIGVIVWHRQRPQRRAMVPYQPWLLMWGWVGLVALVLQLEKLGLPTLRISHINGWVMTLFLPFCLAGGGLWAWLTGSVTHRRYLFHLTAVLVLAAGIWGTQGITHMVNPATILATPGDRAALAWITQNISEDAVFAVNVWPWQSNTYAGSDGGYWIPVLTDRASLLPPLLYGSVLPPETTGQMNNLFLQISQAETLDDPALRARLAEAGVTHLYLGARRHTLQASTLEGRAFAQLLYAQDDVSIYAIHIKNQ